MPSLEASTRIVIQRSDRLRWMRVRWGALLMASIALCAGVSAAPIATANERVVEDPDDTTGVLDIAKVRQGHYFQYVMYRVTTYEAWEAADLAGDRMVFELNLDDDRTIERRGVLEFGAQNGSRMRAWVEDGKGRTVGRAGLRRPSQHSVELWFRRWHLDHPRTYRVSITATSTDDGQCASTCTDRAPDAGSIRHRLHELCYRREPTIIGTKGDDEIHGTERADVIDGRGGNDEIVGVGASDVVCGRGGDDLVEGGQGFMLLSGGPGADRISATGPKPQPCNDTGGGAASCAYPEALLLGGAGGDLLIGGARHERLVGGGGNDTLRGRRWSDGLHGGRGRDELWGGRGDDACKAGEELHSC